MLLKDIGRVDCLQPELVKLERVKYHQRMMMTADTMITEQEYFRQKMRRHNRFLHGWGIVCGLNVTPAPTDAKPWRVQIHPGYALGPYGDEIYVAERVFLDLAECRSGDHTDPCEPDRVHHEGSGVGTTVYVAIKYAECLAQPVRTMPAGCGCEDVDCEYSRVRDSFEIGCLNEFPRYEPELICELLQERRSASCTPCPTEPWVLLARVNLPAPSTELEIVSNFMQPVYSTSLLQWQLIDCCCERGGGTPPQPTHSPVQVSVVTVDTRGPAPRIDLPDLTDLNSSTNVPTIQSTAELTNLTLRIFFNKPIQQVSVNELSIEIKGYSGGQEVVEDYAIDIELEDDRTAVLRGSFPTNREYKIIIHGDSDQPNRSITDIDGLRLDGNKNTVAGDNYRTAFKLAFSK